MQPSIDHVRRPFGIAPWKIQKEQFTCGVLHDIYPKIRIVVQSDVIDLKPDREVVMERLTNLRS